MRLSRAAFVIAAPSIIERSLSLTPVVSSRLSPPPTRRSLRSPAAVPSRVATAMATANGHPGAAGGAAAAPAPPVAASTRSPTSTSTSTPTPPTTLGNGSPPPRAFGPRPTLVLTNDDGVDPPPPATLLLPLARAVAAAAPAYDVLVIAPAANQSACGMRISLGTPLTLTRRRDLEEEGRDSAAARPSGGGTSSARPVAVNGDDTVPLNAQREGTVTVYTLSGSPADAVITAIEPVDGLVAKRGGVPVLVVSGINVGPNLGTDVLYSGTFSAARQSGLYGVPSVAVSLCGGDEWGAAAAAAAALVVRLLAVVRSGGGGGGGGGPTATAAAATATADHHGGEANPGRLDARHWHAVPDAAGVRRAFCRGDLTLNVNVPRGWAGRWATCTLGALFYRGVVGLPPAYTPGEGAAEITGVRVKLGGGRIEKMVLADGPGAGSTTAGTVDSGDGDAADASAAASAAHHAAAHTLTDVAGVEAGLATVTAVSTWPVPHEAAVGDVVLAAALVAGPDGLPAWLAPSGAEAAEEASEGGGEATGGDEAEAMRLEVTRVGGVHVGGSGEVAP
ncbi:hypothetical protein MMPV_006755 [Pyropia vietnamensis]